MSPRTRGAVALASFLSLPAVLLGLVGLAGCGAGPVEIHSAGVSGADRRTCEEIVDRLPHRLAGEEAREVSPAGALGGAWGDPPITFRCGVPRPADYYRGAYCVEADGVGFYVPDDALEDESADVTLTTVGYRPRVELRVPGSYRPEGQAAAMSELAVLLRKHLHAVSPCR